MCWIPGNIGINGNEKTDKASKQALNQQVSPNMVPYTDCIPFIIKYIYNSWQNKWNELAHNKLYEIQTVFGKIPAFINHRKDDSAIRRLRIGHTYFTHGYLLRGEPGPECIPCASTLTVKHILIECVDFSETRNEFYTTDTYKELFEKVPSSQILDYIKAIGIYNLI